MEKIAVHCTNSQSTPIIRRKRRRSAWEGQQVGFRFGIFFGSYAFQLLNLSAWFVETVLRAIITTYWAVKGAKAFIGESWPKKIVFWCVNLEVTVKWTYTGGGNALLVGSKNVLRWNFFIIFDTFHWSFIKLKKSLRLVCDLSLSHEQGIVWIFNFESFSY